MHRIAIMNKQKKMLRLGFCGGVPYKRYKFTPIALVYCGSRLEVLVYQFMIVCGWISDWILI